MKKPLAEKPPKEMLSLSLFLSVMWSTKFARDRRWVLIHAFNEEVLMKLVEEVRQRKHDVNGKKKKKKMSRTHVLF